MFCVKCGTNLPATATFCTKCGAKMATDNATQQTQSKQNSAPEPININNLGGAAFVQQVAKNRPWIILGFVVLVIIALIASCASRNTSGGSGSGSGNLYPGHAPVRQSGTAWEFQALDDFYVRTVTNLLGGTSGRVYGTVRVTYRGGGTRSTFDPISDFRVYDPDGERMRGGVTASRVREVAVGTSQYLTTSFAFRGYGTYTLYMSANRSREGIAVSIPIEWGSRLPDDLSEVILFNNIPDAPWLDNVPDFLAFITEGESVTNVNTASFHHIFMAGGFDGPYTGEEFILITFRGIAVSPYEFELYRQLLQAFGFDVDGDLRFNVDRHDRIGFRYLGNIEENLATLGPRGAELRAIEEANRPPPLTLEDIRMMLDGSVWTIDNETARSVFFANDTLHILPDGNVEIGPPGGDTRRAPWYLSGLTRGENLTPELVLDIPGFMAIFNLDICHEGTWLELFSTRTNHTYRLRALPGDNRPAQQQQQTTTTPATSAPVVSPSGVIMYSISDRQFTSYVPSFLAFATNGATGTTPDCIIMTCDMQYNVVEITHQHRWTQSERDQYVNLLRELGFEVELDNGRYWAQRGDIILGIDFPSPGNVIVNIAHVDISGGNWVSP